MTDERIRRGLAGQLAERERLLRAGATPLGWKVGFNTSAARERLVLDDPVTGFLTDLTIAAGTWSLGECAQPLAEVEVAVVVGVDGTPSQLAPGLELVDVDRPLEDLEALLARNVFHRAWALGPRTEVRAGTVAARLRADGEPIGEGTFDLDTLPAVLATVGRRLETGGEALRAGDVVLAGAIAVAPCAAGQTLSAEVDDLGAVELRLAQ